MSPYQIAREVYAKEPCARSFEQDMRLHLEFGFVFSTPDFFAMGRPVVKEGAPGDIVNPGILFPRKQCNCWHVYLMAGDIGKCWSVMPWPLGWVSFERKNELHFLPMERIRELSLP